MGLGSKSLRGRETEKFLRPFFDRIQLAWDCRIESFGNDSTAVIDGFIVKNGKIRAIFEFKTRFGFYEDGYFVFSGRKETSMIITKTKIDNGVQLSKLLSVPFLIIYGFTENDKCAYFNVTDTSGNLTLGYSVKITETNRTINGDKIFRENCYLPLNEINEI